MIYTFRKNKIFEINSFVNIHKRQAVFLQHASGVQILLALYVCIITSKYGYILFFRIILYRVYHFDMFAECELIRCF